MPRRILAVLVALLCAVLGAVVLVRYVQAADERALAGEETVPVLVVDSEIPEGAGGEEVAGRVSVVDVPARLTTPDSVSDVTALTGLVTTASLLPGEQVRRDRFADPASLLPPGTAAVPVGMVEVSVSLDAQRAAGGALEAGDRVGVQLTNQDAAEPGLTSLSVYKVFHGVLVTRVTPPADTADPNAPYLVTVALPPADASTVVLGSTAQAVWLSLESRATGAGSSSTTPTSGGDK